MRVMFCCDPLHPRAVDPVYADELTAAATAGLATALLDYEALVHDDVERALRRVPEGSGDELLVYRGWMLRPAAYTQLYAALRSRGYLPITTPAAYRHCHYFPESYAIIAAQTARGVWLPFDAASALDMNTVMRLLEPFGQGPVVLKDYVKSRKHEWDEACYIPSAADRVVSRFLELQGADLSEGLVFREYAPLRQLATHPQSGMPLACEHRLFYLDGELLAVAPYWDEGDYSADTAPPLESFTQVAQRVQSQFFTLDIAQRQNGDWTIIELGDAQVAGLPAHLDLAAFYTCLGERLTCDIAT